MISKYRESNWRADNSLCFLIAVAELWCHTPIGLRSADAPQTCLMSSGLGLGLQVGEFFLRVGTKLCRTAALQDRYCLALIYANLHLHVPGVSSPTPGGTPSSRIYIQPQLNKPEPVYQGLQAGFWCKLELNFPGHWPFWSRTGRADPPYTQNTQAA